MKISPGSTKNSATWRRRTKAVRGGTRRSGFGETSEAIFLTSGYAYSGPEEAEARFKGENFHHIW